MLTHFSFTSSDQIDKPLHAVNSLNLLVIFMLCHRILSASKQHCSAGGGDVQVVWAQLPCQRVMYELCSTRFAAHPALSHVLNLHLQDNVMSQPKLKAMERKMTEVEQLAHEAKKLADKKGGQRGGPSGRSPVGAPDMSWIGVGLLESHSGRGGSWKEWRGHLAWWMALQIVCKSAWRCWNMVWLQLVAPHSGSGQGDEVSDIIGLHQRRTCFELTHIFFYT